MAYKTLIFGVDDMFNQLQPYYLQEVQRGILDIVAYAFFEKNKLRLITPDGKPASSKKFELAIISSKNNFYNRMKFLESKGFARNRIIDGRVFKVPNLNFPRLLEEGVAYGVLDKNSFNIGATIYKQVYTLRNGTIFSLGMKSYVNGILVEGGGKFQAGNFCSISSDVIVEVGRNQNHNYRNVSSYPAETFNWQYPKEFYPPQGQCKIEIGNDVWIGRGNILKCTNPEKPLIIGDGAVIAADSVVVKNVPPYAIVGGNPAQIIKYRFPPHIIDAFLRIKWWDWSMDKIYENFKYFNDIEKFISLHDK